MTNELPEPWAAELSDKGIHSYRDFARAIEGSIGAETLRRLATGGKTSVGTVNRVAKALFDDDRDKVWALHGVAVEDHGDWELPDEASLLNEAQREAIKAVVKAMVPDVAAAPKATVADLEKRRRSGRTYPGASKNAARKKTD